MENTIIIEDHRSAYWTYGGYLKDRGVWWNMAPESTFETKEEAVKAAADLAREEREPIAVMRVYRTKTIEVSEEDHIRQIADLRL
jgi:hypothetical protein